jgi:hypothetical protein
MSEPQCLKTTRYPLDLSTCTCIGSIVYYKEMLRQNNNINYLLMENYIL